MDPIYVTLGYDSYHGLCKQLCGLIELELIFNLYMLLNMFIHL